MKQLKVNLWGNEIGRLRWDAATRRIFFQYNPDLSGSVPDIAPLMYPAATRNILSPVYGDERPMYQGLPPFIADSLPDSWGNTLFDRWIRDNRIPRNKVTPLYRLMFIGTRGMGALEYEPCASELTHTREIDIKSLYDISLKVLEERDNVVLNTHEELTLQALLAVGTSAGGRQMKAIIAINDQTGEIRSGQTEGLAGFEYYILKFGDSSIPIAEIEAAYYKMAIHAGINMEECRLLDVEGISHFLTRRFDRKNGNKIHIQTLAAINPEARSYEDLFATCRELNISETDIRNLFIRMVFNVMANNTDDHNKNFTFRLEEHGRWELAPAYDMTFIFNRNGTAPNIERRLSICGKTADITRLDLLDFAAQNDIRNAGVIISRVADALGHFKEYAAEYGITQPWQGIIQNALDENLIAFGYKERIIKEAPTYHDRFGRIIVDFSVSVNSKRYYEVSAIIDGNRRRRFIKPSTPLYNELRRQDVFNLSPEDKVRFVELLLPPEGEDNKGDEKEEE